jgi:hypothetical protein
MEETERLEHLYAGAADRKAADAAEQLALSSYQRWRAKKLAMAALFGPIAFEFLAF